MQFKNFKKKKKKRKTSLMHKKEKMKKLARMEDWGHTKTRVGSDLPCTAPARSGSLRLDSGWGTPWSAKRW